MPGRKAFAFDDLTAEVIQERFTEIVHQSPRSTLLAADFPVTARAPRELRGAGGRCDVIAMTDGKTYKVEVTTGQKRKESL